MTWVCARFPDGGHHSELVEDDMAVVVIARIEAVGGEVYLSERTEKCETCGSLFTASCGCCQEAAEYGETVR